MKVYYEQTIVEKCVNDTVRAWVRGDMTVEELRKFHGEVGESNRRAVQEEDFECDSVSLRFMHQVTKGALMRLKTSDRRIGLREQAKQIGSWGMGQLEAKDY